LLCVALTLAVYCRCMCTSSRHPSVHNSISSKPRSSKSSRSKTSTCAPSWLGICRRPAVAVLACRVNGAVWLHDDASSWEREWLFFGNSELVGAILKMPSDWLVYFRDSRCEASISRLKMTSNWLAGARSCVSCRHEEQKRCTFGV